MLQKYNYLSFSYCLIQTILVFHDGICEGNKLIWGARPGSYMAGDYNLESYSDIPLSSCMENCEQSSSCKSFNYYNDRNCGLKAIEPWDRDAWESETFEIRPSPKYTLYFYCTDSEWIKISQHIVGGPEGIDYIHNVTELECKESCAEIADCYSVEYNFAGLINFDSYNSSSI